MKHVLRNVSQSNHLNLPVVYVAIDAQPGGKVSETEYARDVGRN